MDAVVVRRRRLPLSRRALRSATDERLVEQVRAGSRNAFEEIYDRHHRGILAFCRHILDSQEEAEDVVQHTFTAAYQSLLSDRRQIVLKAWLYAVARNRCLSLLRARREHADIADPAISAPATAGLPIEVERRDDLRALLADVQLLPQDQRAALVLAELGAHSHDEIAVILGVRATKVKALVFQAREALMIRRQARDADCAEIRDQLAVLHGGALRRRKLRHHLEQCAGCRAFADEMRRQRAGMAVLLSVVPSHALKDSTISGAFSAVGSAAAPGAVVVMGGGPVLAAGGATVAGGGTVAGATAVAAKVLLTLTIIGGGGGYVTVERLRQHPSRTPSAHTDPAPRPGMAAPIATGSVTAKPAAASPAAHPSNARRDHEGDEGEHAQPVRQGSARGPRGRQARPGRGAAAPRGKPLDARKVSPAGHERARLRQTPQREPRHPLPNRPQREPRHPLPNRPPREQAAKVDHGRPPAPGSAPERVPKPPRERP